MNAHYTQIKREIETRQNIFNKIKKTSNHQCYV